MFVRSTRAAILAVASLLLVAGGLRAPSSANETPSTFSFQGVMAPTSAFKPLVVGLCETACIDTDERGSFSLASAFQASIDETGSFTLAGVPASGYELALVYQSADSAGQMSTRAGYLRLTAIENYEITRDFDKGVTIPVTADVDLGTIVVTPPTVTVRLPPTTARVVHQGGGFVLGETVSARYRLVHASTSTVVRQSVKGCGDVIVARKKVTGVTGSKTWFLRMPLARIPRVVWVRTVVSEPGRRDRVGPRVGLGPIPGARC